MVVIIVCFMTNIHSTIQLSSILDEGKRGEVEAVMKNLDDDEHKMLIRLMEDDHISIFWSIYL
jgi:hypothetical protein